MSSALVSWPEHQISFLAGWHKRPRSKAGFCFITFNFDCTIVIFCSTCFMFCAAPWLQLDLVCYSTTSQATGWEDRVFAPIKWLAGKIVAKMTVSRKTDAVFRMLIASLLRIFIHHAIGRQNKAWRSQWIPYAVLNRFAQTSTILQQH